jgi:hypothetical protein
MHDLGEFDTIVYSHAVDALGNYQFQPAAPPNPRRQRFELVAHIIECAPMYWRYFLCDTVGFRLAEVVLAVLLKNLSLRTVSVRSVSHMPSPRPPLRNSLLRTDGEVSKRSVPKSASSTDLSLEHRPVAPSCLPNGGQAGIHPGRVFLAPRQLLLDVDCKLSFRLVGYIKLCWKLISSHQVS